MTKGMAVLAAVLLALAAAGRAHACAGTGMEGPEPQRYLVALQQRVLARLRVAPVEDAREVALAFRLGADGTVSDARVVSGDAKLGGHALEALLDAQPFPRLSAAEACLADQEITARFSLAPNAP